MDVESEDVALQVMNDAVKNMIREFRQLERPFLNPRGEVSDEKGYLDEDEIDWLNYYRTNHRRCGLRESHVVEDEERCRAVARGVE